MKPEPKPELPRVIKRYQNRKLYDTEHSCYVTLDEIAQMVKEGEDVRIIDNRDGSDLTNVTLAQIVFEEEKKQSLLPIAALRNIIQSGGESLMGFFQKSLHTGVHSISNVREEAEKVIDKIKDEFEDSSHYLRDIFLRTNRSIDDLQHKIEERLRHPFGRDSKIKFPDLKFEIRSLRKKLVSMERRLRHDRDGGK